MVSVAVAAVALAAGLVAAVLGFGADRAAESGERRPAEQSKPSPPDVETREPSALARVELTPTEDVGEAEQDSVEPAEPVLVEPEPRAEPPPSEWPPARAFTARCRAAGGGCAPECTELAGSRCLDPCFIHTTECSTDCRLPDGSCGFPPPDTE